MRDEVDDILGRRIAQDTLTEMGKYAGGEGSDLFACSQLFQAFMVEMLHAASDFELCCYIHGLGCGEDDEREETCRGSLDRLRQIREIEKQILALEF